MSEEEYDERVGNLLENYDAPLSIKKIAVNSLTVKERLSYLASQPKDYELSDDDILFLAKYHNMKIEIKKIAMLAKHKGRK